MNLAFQFAMSGALMVASSQPSFAVQVLNPTTVVATNVASVGVIDRGGTITDVNRAKRTVAVDGVQYALPAKSINVHEAGGRVTEKNPQLKAGMQIQFTTSKNNYAAQEQIQEVWITGISGKKAKKVN